MYNKTQQQNKQTMKNMIKIFSIILVITLGTITFINCGGSKSTDTTDSTSVVVDTTSVSDDSVSVGELPKENIK